MEVARRWAASDPLAEDHAPAAAPVAAMPPPPPAPAGFGYVWNPPYGYVMVPLNPIVPVPAPGTPPTMFTPVQHPNGYAPRPGEIATPGHSPHNAGGRLVRTFQPQGTMLVKQGDRDPWDERLAQLPEMSVPGAPPPGMFDAMEGRFNPALQSELSSVASEIRSSFPSAAGFNPLEGAGAEAAGRVHHSKGSVGPLGGGGG